LSIGNEIRAHLFHIVEEEMVEELLALLFKSIEEVELLDVAREVVKLQKGADSLALKCLYCRWQQTAESKSIALSSCEGRAFVDELETT
jgi:hypothetical protein